MVESSNSAKLTNAAEIKAHIQANPNPVIMVFGSMGVGKSTFVANLTGLPSDASS